MDTATRAGNQTELFEACCNRERVAILFNPASGTGDSQTRRAQLEALKEAAGLTGELRETDRDQGATPLARAAVQEGMERLLISGGDGSVMEAADALAGSDTALAVLPGGTGNLLAVNLGLPTAADEAVRLALTGQARPLDVGRANGAVFLIVAGMGLDARMVRDADRELKRRLGVLAYFVSTWRNLGRPPVRFTITVDGRRRVRRAQSVLVANLGRITGGLELVPGADPEDGWLDVAVLRAQGVWDLAVIAWRGLLGPASRRCERQGRSDPLLELFRGREILVETERPQPVQLDGNEQAPTTRLEVHVEPGALQLVRAPTTDEAGRPLPGAPKSPLARVAGAVARPLLLGGIMAAGLSLRGRRSRARGRRPVGLERYSPLVGLALAGIVWWLRGTLDER
jgi:diacylglycerol kinase (ATP)